MLDALQNIDPELSEIARDGIFADACQLDNGVTSLAVVLMCDGEPIEEHSKLVDGWPNVLQAERDAVAWAMELFPGSVVFTDCQGAANVDGVICIPRTANLFAHNLARRAAGVARAPVGCSTGKGLPKHKNKKASGRFRGRGVVPPRESRMRFPQFPVFTCD